MLSRNPRVVTVASNAELSNPAYYRRLWIATRNLKIPRRKWLDLLAETFLCEEIFIVQPSGAPYAIPLVDDVFGDDPEMRWLSYYLKSDETRRTPASMSRKYERLRLIDLYFRIHHPKIAAHFSR